MEKEITFVNQPSQEGIARAWEVIFRHYESSSDKVPVPILQERDGDEKKEKQA